MPLPVSTHSRLKAAGVAAQAPAKRYAVSTHSRLKAAGYGLYLKAGSLTGFNTQPPEGGWQLYKFIKPDR